MAKSYLAMKSGERKKYLFQIGLKALEKNGWAVQQTQDTEKPSLRCITKGGKKKWVVICTSQSTRIRFSRKHDDSGWKTLDDSEIVVAVSVDSREKPQFAQVHLINSDELQQRFDRAYKARLKSRKKVAKSWGSSIHLYKQDDENTLSHIGAGAGLDNPAIFKIPLNKKFADKITKNNHTEKVSQGITTTEAKQQLALKYGVKPKNVKITIEI